MSVRRNFLRGIFLGAKIFGEDTKFQIVARGTKKSADKKSKVLML